MVYKYIQFVLFLFLSRKYVKYVGQLFLSHHYKHQELDP